MLLLEKWKKRHEIRLIKETHYQVLVFKKYKNKVDGAKYRSVNAHAIDLDKIMIKAPEILLYISFFGRTEGQ